MSDKPTWNIEAVIQNLRDLHEADYPVSGPIGPKLQRACGEAALLIGDLVIQLAAAQAVIDKLPKYSDTGEPFVPDVDAVFACGRNGPPLRILARRQIGIGPLYSTPEAAAKEAVK